MNDDSADLHDRAWRDWDFLLAMAHRELRKKGLHDHDPADVAEHVVLTISEQLKEGKLDKTKVRTWRGLQTTIARNKILNLVKDSKKQHVVPFVEELAPPQPFEEPMWERLDQERLRKLVDLLPEPLRSLIAARHEDGMSVSGAAAVVGVSPDQAQRMIAGLRRKIEVVDRGGALRLEDRDALTAFAHGVLALRDERNGSD